MGHPIRRKGAAITGLAVVVLAGCATAGNKYRPPAEGPRATVSVHWKDPNPNTRVLVHDEVCTVAGAQLAGRLADRTWDGAGTGDTLTFQVPAGKPVGLSVGAIRSALGTFKKIGEYKGQAILSPVNPPECDKIIDFTPVQGGRYWLEVDLPEKTAQYCVLSLSTVDASGKSTPEPSALTRQGCNVPFRQ